MRPRYRKVIRDVGSDWVKSLLLVLAIAVGVFGVGTVLGAYAVLNREIDRNYLGTHPAEATLAVDRRISPHAVAAAIRTPGVAAAERRAIVTARVRVGGLGLMSTVSMSILERTRELGVMRALGATPGRIFRLLVIEGLTIGVVSLPLAVLAALPLSYVVGSVVGRMSFLMPLPPSISVPGLAGWLTLVVVGSVAATAFPARNAARISVREALAYE